MSRVSPCASLDEPTRYYRYLCDPRRPRSIVSSTRREWTQEWIHTEHGECAFHVWRQRTSPRIFACSFWMGNETSDYVLTLLNALYWWTLEFPALLDASRLRRNTWNVRFYIDAALPLHHHIDNDTQTTWQQLFEWMASFSHVELYFYDCRVGYQKRPQTPTETSHAKTFGSLLRLHALTDSALECVAIRNVEALTSMSDLNQIHRWWRRNRLASPPGIPKPWVLSCMTTRARQHHLARQWLLHSKTLKPGELGTSGFGLGLCLCSLTVIQSSTETEMLLPKWSQVLATARIWNTWATTEATDMIDLEDRADFAYGVDEFVTDVALYPLLARYPDQVSLLNGHMDVGEYLKAHRQLTNKDEWHEFLRHYASGQLQRQPQTSPDYVQMHFREIIRRSSLFDLSRADYVLDPIRASFPYTWIAESYRFALAAQRFLRRKAMPVPSSLEEKNWVASYVRYELAHRCDLICLKKQEWTQRPPPPLKTASEKRRVQLLFWASRSLDDIRILLMPGWAFKSKPLLWAQKQVKYDLRRDFIQASREEIAYIYRPFPAFRLKRPVVKTPAVNGRVKKRKSQRLHLLVPRK